MTMKSLPGALLIALVVSAADCGGSPATPSRALSPTPTPTPAPLAITSLRISGNATLAAIGETSQLAAIATYSDGTTKDVTEQAAWTSLTPGYFIVSSGLLTVVGFGFGSVSARLQKTTSIAVLATPPGTFVFRGRARDPGAGGLPGVRVLETASNRTQVTDENGEFQFAGLAAARLRLDKDGYEAVPEVIGSPAPVGYSDVAMQPIVRLAVGESIKETLAPHDLAYTIGSDRCFPCKLIHVVSPSGGAVNLNVTWTAAPNALNLWVNGNRFAAAGSNVAADVAAAAGDNTVYVGWSLAANQTGASSYLSFTLTTSPR
jgi:hypothetical protein